MSDSAIDRIERRLEHEHHLSDNTIELVLGVVEEELVGDTDHDPDAFEVRSSGTYRRDE